MSDILPQKPTIEEIAQQFKDKQNNPGKSHHDIDPSVFMWSEHAQSVLTPEIQSIIRALVRDEIYKALQYLKSEAAG